MNISIIGAGHMGSAIAQVLVEHESVSLVNICDAHIRTLQRLEGTIDSPKLRTFQVDARDERTLSSLLEDSDCIVGASSTALNPILARTALHVGSHFCDLGSGSDLLGNSYGLEKAAQAQALWIVPNCGLDPGLANMLCLYGLQQFDEPESGHIRVGYVPLHPEPPFNFRISWAAEKLLDDYTMPVIHMLNGEITQEEPLSGVEEITFPEPFGAMEAFHTASVLAPVWESAGPSMRTMTHKSIRWKGHAEQMQFLLALGFAEDKNLDVQTHLTYRDILARRIKQRMGGDYEDAVLLRIVVEGVKDGQRKRLSQEMIDTYDETRDMTAVRRGTSITAANIAMLLASGSVRKGGVSTPERIIPLETFYKAVCKAGLPIQETWTQL